MWCLHIPVKDRTSFLGPLLSCPVTSLIHNCVTDIKFCMPGWISLCIYVEGSFHGSGLVKLVERTVRLENHRSPSKPIYLVGESLGACLALAVAARNPDIDLVLVLVNPGEDPCILMYHWWEFEIQCFSCVYECLEIEGNGQQWHHVKQICRMYQRLQ